MPKIKVKCHGCGKEIKFDAEWFRKNTSETSIFHCSDECFRKITGVGG